MAAIHEFDPQIYPRKLWIAVSKDTFSDILDGVVAWDESAEALTEHVCDKVNKNGGVLIRFANNNVGMNEIAHEATHAALEIYAYCDIKVDTDNQEHFAYLVGWIADCCEKVLKIDM